MHPRLSMLIICTALLLPAIWGYAEGEAAPPAGQATAHPRAEATYENFTISAETLEVDPDTSEVNARGNVEVESKGGGTINASSARYNTRTGVGFLDDVHGSFNPFRFSARSMTIDAQGVKHVQNADLTTCIKEQPHYELLARDFIIDPDQRIQARHISFAVNGHRLFTFPSIRGKLGDGGKTYYKPLVSFGKSHIDGIYVNTNYLVPVGKQDELTVNARIGTTGAIRGGLTYAHPFALSPKFGHGTVSLIASHREDVENRLIDVDQTVNKTLQDLTISRLPAVQLALDPMQLPLPHVSLQLGAGYGRYHEEPTDVSRNRAQGWGILHSPLATMGKFDLFAEYGLRHVRYSEDDRSNTNILQLTLQTPIRENNYYYNISYLHRKQTGATPFLFDKVLIPNELYTELEVPVFHSKTWALGAWQRYDLSEHKLRDYDISAIYKLDCMSFKAEYNFASRSFGVGIMLNAFGTFRRGAGDIGFTQ